MDRQTVFRIMFKDATQEIWENSLDFYLRLKVYSYLAYPDDQFDDTYRYNERMIQFVAGLDPQMAATQTIKEIDHLMVYMLCENGYI